MKANLYMVITRIPDLKPLTQALPWSIVWTQLWTIVQLSVTHNSVLAAEQAS